ncbi:hypothetical protein KP509_02G104600 [Ceratopteris richardii]|uniref:Uncharacterized protein n=1 Tax=Ceratopteris richardii TaxID=49495 RepID=A0A8T2VHD8_CERRI|nr:hypothetical protein KP509_02G104600 [Ceratopteris richardii]
MPVHDEGFGETCATALYDLVGSIWVFVPSTTSPRDSSSHSTRLVYSAQPHVSRHAGRCYVWCLFRFSLLFRPCRSPSKLWHVQLYALQTLSMLYDLLQGAMCQESSFVSLGWSLQLLLIPFQRVDAYAYHFGCQEEPLWLPTSSGRRKVQRLMYHLSHVPTIQSLLCMLQKLAAVITLGIYYRHLDGRMV